MEEQFATKTVTAVICYWDELNCEEFLRRYMDGERLPEYLIAIHKNKKILGIAKVVGQTSTGSAFLTLLIFISLNLGIVNLLPIPPLDGGKLLFIIIEGITRKRPNPKIELYLQMAGMALLILLMVFVTFNDITRNMSIF